MNELAVKYTYETPVRTTLSAVLRWTFPIWGVVLPVAGVIALFSFLALVISSQFGSGGAFSLVTLLIGIAVPLCLLRFSKLVENKLLTADRNGIELPASLGLASEYVPWNTIDNVQVVYQGDSPTVSDSVLILAHGGASSKFACNLIVVEELERLLLAIQLWAPPSALGPAFTELQKSVKATAMLPDGHSQAQSYTAIWEDELKRRFRQVAFVPLEPGCVVRNGSLRLVRQLSMGGLSAIYLCLLEERELVVLKEAVIPDDSQPELKAKASELFEREAQFLMKLDNPNIVKVLDYFVEDLRTYLLLEYVNGQDLRQYVLQNGRPRQAVVIGWAEQIASILCYLHRREPPIVHRDLTPDNLVIREDGIIVLIDFGAANEFIGTSTGTFVGKQCYIAPEQFRGRATPQSDIYAFGCTLHFLLTGCDPEPLSVLNPQQIVQSIPTELNDLVAACTQLDLERRLTSAEELAQRLAAPSLKQSSPGS